jgi:hypothetical protein
MSDLSNTIYDYYCEHFTELPLDKQLHFASRLWVWRRDPRARELLDSLRPEILPSNDGVDSVRRILDDGLLPIRPGSLNVLHIRQPFFDRYPSLRRSAAGLYWAQLLDTCYDTDVRSRIHEVIDLPAATQLAADLLADTPAVAALSTYAVNFLYLLRRFVEKDEAALDPAYFLQIAADNSLYSGDDRLNLQLRIYLLTHAVIGESLFYSRPIADAKKPAFQRLIGQLEELIVTHFDDVNLDNKLEFVVCCKLVGTTSQPESRILAEADQSVSPDGDFLVDTRNANIQSSYTGIDKSEHRNVLYIMSQSRRSTAL